MMTERTSREQVAEMLARRERAFSVLQSLGENNSHWHIHAPDDLQPADLILAVTIRTDMPKLANDYIALLDEHERYERAMRDVIAQRIGVEHTRPGRYLEDLLFANSEHLRAALEPEATP